jgi:hypothetical protein
MLDLLSGKLLQPSQRPPTLQDLDVGRRQHEPGAWRQRLPLRRVFLSSADRKSSLQAQLTPSIGPAQENRMPLRLAVFAVGLIAAGALAVQAQPIGKDLSNAGHAVANTGSSVGHAAADTGRAAGHTAAKTGRTVGHGTAQTARHVSHGAQKAVGANPK